MNKWGISTESQKLFFKAKAKNTRTEKILEMKSSFGGFIKRVYRAEDNISELFNINRLEEFSRLKQKEKNE